MDTQEFGCSNSLPEYKFRILRWITETVKNCKTWTGNENHRSKEVKNANVFMCQQLKYGQWYIQFIYPTLVNNFTSLNQDLINDLQIFNIEFSN
jgi:hypothetical protein